MFCPKCGTNVPEGSKFCETCGNNMQSAEPADEQEQSEQPVESTQQPEPAAPQPVQASQPASQPQPQPRPASYQQPQAQSYQQGSQNSGYQQAPQPAPAYQNTYQNSYNNDDFLDKPYSVGGWLLTFLILIVPIVNIIMPFVWAFGSNTNKSKKNFFIAYLIMAAIGIVLGIAFYGILATVIDGILSQMSY